MLDWLLDRMAQAADAPAIAHGAHVSTYRALLARVAQPAGWGNTLVVAGRRP